MKYVGVVVNNNNDNTDRIFTYGCEYEDIKIGQKVYVPFNRGNKRTVAYVFNIFDNVEIDLVKLKYVDEIDTDICLSQDIIDTVIFMKNRYLCRYIEAINLFVPSGKPSKRKERKSPLDQYKGEDSKVTELTEEQRQALEEINKGIDGKENPLILLNGATASGKTEVYMRAVEKVINKQQTAIMLTPEIGLTKQVIDRFIGKFGRSEIAVIHSKLSAGERFDQWQRIKSGEAKIVIGARSAVFAPLNNIGIIILDEEHESTYKSDKSPKYDTVEIAIKRLKGSKGVLLLGSATPSVNSYYRSTVGIYRRIDMPSRYNGKQTPKVIPVDMRKELKEGNRSLFSAELYDQMKNSLEKGKQVILLMNRRGYATFISCRECGYVLKCDDCDISYTYHKGENKAVCHYCGKKISVPNICPKCGSKYIKYFGAGTERVVEEVEKYFPEYTVEKMDLDSVSKKGSIEKMLDKFEKNEINILVGTQLVAKGLDFKNVHVVGIVAADATLNIPDFRSSERTFQLIKQAIGRAGRGEEQGVVVLQTYQQENYSIEAAINQNYMQFYKKEIEIRELMNYPPFGYLIEIMLFGKGKKTKNYASEIERELRSKIPLKEIVSTSESNGDEEYKKYILIKCSQKKRNSYIKIIGDIKEKMIESRVKLKLIVDVNPYNIWRN